MNALAAFKLGTLLHSLQKRLRSRFQSRSFQSFSVTNWHTFHIENSYKICQLSNSVSIDHLGKKNQYDHFTQGTKPRFHGTYNQHPMKKHVANRFTKPNKNVHKHASSLLSLDWVAPESPNLVEAFLDYTWWSMKISSELENIIAEFVPDQIEETSGKIQSILNQFETIRPCSDFGSSLVEACIILRSPELSIRVFNWFYKHQTHLNLESIDKILSLLRFDPIFANIYPSILEKSKSISIKKNRSHDAHKNNFKQHGTHDKTNLKEGQNTIPDYEISRSNKEISSTNIIHWTQFISSPSDYIDSFYLIDLSKTSKEGYKDGFKPLFQVKPSILPVNVVGERKERLMREYKLKSDVDLNALEIKDQVILEVAIAELCQRDLIKDALSLLDRTNAHIISRCRGHIFSPIARYYLKEKNVDGIMDILKKMMILKIAPTIDLVNILIDLHSRTNNWMEAKQLFSKLDQYQLDPNIETINIMIREMVIRKSKKDARALLVEAKRRWQIEPNEKTWKLLLQLASNLNLLSNAQYYFSRIEHHDVMDYIHIMDIYVTNLMLDQFYATFKQMEKDHPAHNIQSLSQLCRLFIKSNQIEQIPNTLNYFKQKYDIAPSKTTLYLVIEKALAQKKLHIAFELEQYREKYLDILTYGYTDIFYQYLAFHPSFEVPSWLKCHPGRDTDKLSLWQVQSWQKSLVQWRETWINLIQAKLEDKNQNQQAVGNKKEAITSQRR